MSDVETNANGGRQSRLAERTDLLPPAAVLAVARVLKGGAAKYGDRNWRLIGVREHLNHALTHAYKYLAGDAEEPHLHNAACRLMMALEIELVGMDRPEGFPRLAAEPVPADPPAWPAHIPKDWAHYANCCCDPCRELTGLGFFGK
jgi:hypothetical protein